MKCPASVCIGVDRTEKVTRVDRSTDGIHFDFQTTQLRLNYYPRKPLSHTHTRNQPTGDEGSSS